MMTRGVMSQAANLIGNGTEGVALKGKQSNSGFDLMFGNTMKLGLGVTNHSESSEVKRGSKQNAVNSKKEKSNAVDGGAKQAEDTSSNLAKTDNAKATAHTDNQTKKVENTSKIEDVKVDVTEETEVDEATLEKIAGLLQEVQKTVMDLLKLSAEELEKLLAEQGLELADLLQPENLQQLVLADSQAANILAILTDENLSDTMNQLLQSVEELMVDADLGLSPDQIKNILDQAKLLQEDDGVTDLEGLAEDNIIMNQKLNADDTGKATNRMEEDHVSASTKESNIQVEVVKVTDSKEGSSGTQSGLNEKDNQDINMAEQYELFLNNLSNASTTTQFNSDGNMVQVTEIRDIANQIIERIRVTIRPDQSSMELQLNPENLGKVSLAVQSKNGVMTAQFVVQNEISKEAIESQLQSLKDTLNQQGIKVEAIEVAIADYTSQQNNQENAEGQAETKQEHNSKKISLEEAINMSEETGDDISQDITDLRGSQIDYTA